MFKSVPGGQFTVRFGVVSVVLVILVTLLISETSPVDTCFLATVAIRLGVVYLEFC